MITPSTQQRPYSWSAKGPISLNALLSHAAIVASDLPDFRYVINLCEDRYLFSVGFLASLQLGQVTLLPPARENHSALEDLADFGEYYVLIDRGALPPESRPCHYLDYLHVHENWHGPGPSEWVSDRDKPAIVAFTSGSTGTPKPHPKTWQSLVSSTQMALARFNLAGCHMVATVPPQHMYGLECTVLYPLLENIAVYAGRPFFPEDIRATLAAIPGPRVLVTSPLHLRACMGAGLQWPQTDLIISATAPLPPSMAAEVEQMWGTRLREIYGCTETGAIASRDTTVSNRWELYDGMRLVMKQSAAYAYGPQLDAETPLPDVVHQVDDTHFELVGRATDQINVAGKRASLAELNNKLLTIEGVEDGVILMNDSGDPGEIVRPVALVVAPSLDETRLRARLSEVMPAVFVPRPIYFVPSLPRTQSGKLPRDDLLAIVNAKRRIQSAATGDSTNSSNRAKAVSTEIQLPPDRDPE